MKRPTERTTDELSADFFLIRHGESEANAGLPTPSPAAIRLTETGHAQAAALAGRLEVKPALVVVSPYLRTRETAAPFLARHPTVAVEEWPVQEFTYLDIERHAGTTEAERGRVVEDYWTGEDPSWNDGSGAESFADFIGRVDTVLDRLRGCEGGPVIVFTHGYFIHAVEQRLARPAEVVDGELMRSFRRTWPENAPGHCETRVYRLVMGNQNRSSILRTAPGFF